MQQKLLIALCLLLPFAGLTQGRKKHRKQQAAAAAPAPLPDGTDYKQPGAPMPPVRLVTMEGKVYDNKALEGGGNLFLMFFNPSCDHCMEMTRQLQKNVFLFKKSKVVLVAGESMGKYVTPFLREMNMSQYSATLPVTLDSSATIGKLFLYQSLPQINVYDHDRKLIRVFAGLSSVDSLRQYIE